MLGSHDKKGYKPSTYSALKVSLLIGISCPTVPCRENTDKIREGFLTHIHTFQKKSLLKELKPNRIKE